MSWSGAHFVKRHSAVVISALACLMAAMYWGFLASDRYVSEARILIQRTDLPGGQRMDFGALIGGVSTSSRADQLLLREHLMSVDMLRKLDAELGLRAHFSDPRRDLLSRMWFADASVEWFHRHFLSRVAIDFDEYAGVLVVRAQGYDPKTAHRLATHLVQEGEAFMNQMARALASEQVTFLEHQVTTMNERVVLARQALLDFQDSRGTAAPQAEAEGIVAIIARLEGQRAELQTRRGALQAYLVPDHPSIVMLNQQISAVDRQIERERRRLAAPSGKPLNRTVEAIQRLEMEASFAQDLYRTALTALEKGRVEATRTLKKVSVVQTPSMPEYPLEPRRAYNTLVFAIFAAMMAGVVQLLLAIVRDHRD